VLRATIDVFPNVDLLLAGNGVPRLIIGEELLWARYLPENEVSKSIVKRLKSQLIFILPLRLKVMAQPSGFRHDINRLTYDLCLQIFIHLYHKRKKEVMTKFYVSCAKDDVSIIDDTPETKDAQVYGCS